jgi:carbamoyl-phosphate synthase small subunit
VNPEDVESRRPFVRGFVMRECCFEPSNFRATQTLPEYLREHNIVAIDGVDTRRLTKKIRTQGAMKSIISTIDLDHESLVRKAKASQDMVGSDFVREVTIDEPFVWNPDFAGEFHVVALDYGIKYNILRLLEKAGCRVTVVPATISAEDILALEPDGIFLSNGPGDPEPLGYAVQTIRDLLGYKPMFGICLGIQLLGLALGGRTYKLKFGHHGANQPVQDLATGKVAVTSQNHGFAVDLDSLDPDLVQVTHINLNDRTVEGFRHKGLPVFAVQYHPEAAPGPHDATYLFENFVTLMKEYQ